MDQKRQKFLISDQILCAESNAAIKNIEQHNRDAIMTSFLMVNRGKTVTQQCNSLVKRYRSVFFIAFRQENKGIISMKLRDVTVISFGHHVTTIYHLIHI